MILEITEFIKSGGGGAGGRGGGGAGPNIEKKFNSTKAG